MNEEFPHNIFYIYIYIYMYMHMFMYMCMYVHMYMYMYMYVYMYVYVYVYVCMCLCMSMYTYMYMCCSICFVAWYDLELEFNHVGCAIFRAVLQSFLWGCEPKLPFRGAYVCDPQKYNYIFPCKLLAFAGITEHLIFRIIWQMGGSICVQNTAAGCGNDLPTRLGNHISAKKYVWMRLSIVFHMSSPICGFFYVSDKVPQAKWPYRQWDHFIVFMKKWLWHGI